MADGRYQLAVDDDAPGIAYFPLVNLEPSPNVSAGWQLMYTVSGVATGPGQVGVGSSYHYTSLNGASLMLNWNGTGIDLVGTVSNALYSVSLDGTPSAYAPDPAHSILVSLDNLENTNHSLLLTTIIMNSTSPNAFLAFDKAVITYAPPNGTLDTTATSQAIADSDIAFMGLWNYVTDSTGNSMHTSTSAGDSAKTTFQGSAITIYGLTSSYSGNFTVTLDNVTTNLSARSSYNNSDSLLFYATDLSEDMLHHITVTNQENGTLALRAGGVNVTTFGNNTASPVGLSSRSSLPAGTIAAIVLAVVLFLVLAGIVYFVYRIRRKPRVIYRHASLRGDSKPSAQKRDDIERATSTYVPSGEEVESNSLSTSKGYGFGLGLRRGFTLLSRRNKTGSNSSERSRNGTVAHPESHPIAPQHDRDEKRLSIFTLTEDLPVLVDAPESEKLAPGWYNPVALAPPFNWKETQGMTLPELRIQPAEPTDNGNGDDADLKTLTSHQDEALVATLLLSPRISEALAVIGGGAASRLTADVRDNTRRSDESQPPEFLRVRDVSPFRIDVSSIFGTRKGARDSKRSSGSGCSTWSRVRSRLYRRAHRDDGRQSNGIDKQEGSSSSGPERVPVVMHEPDSVNPPVAAAPGSETYSFLDFTSSQGSLGQYSKSTTPSSLPAELGHATGEASELGENPLTRPLRIERSRDVLAPKPDAPSTVSGGSHPSVHSDTHITPTAPTVYTQASSHFPFPITIPSSSHIAQPPDLVPEPRATPSPPRTPPPSDQYLQVPQITRPEPVTPANSPTESVPFSVSEIHFRHSFSDHAGLDSRRGSAASVLPPHPPLPRLDGSPTSAPTYSPPPPYIVQRVLGLPTSPLSPLSPVLRANPSRATPLPSNLIAVRRPGTAPTQVAAPTRVGSLLGPRPRPSTAGSVRISAAPQLPMQGGRSGGLRGQR